MSPEPVAITTEPQKSPTRSQPSPTKSSLSRNTRYGHSFDPENGTWSDDEDSYGHELPPGKALLRHPKSVTFDAAPPQVNEYEMTTPDPSSIASESREGSYDSVEDDGEEREFGFQAHGGHDDSFDASLEDTDKTPVVLPEDWRFMSPDRANDELASTFDDPFETRKPSPTETIQPQPGEAQPQARSDSRNSDGESRPLPPLPPPPAVGAMRERSSSNSSLQATAERVASAQRNLPSPPRPASISKAELQGMGSSAVSLEDRLRLMMLQEDEKKSPSSKGHTEEQRERRLRRGGFSPDSRNLDFRIHEDGSAGNEEVDFDFQLPTIKRESILRKVKNQQSTNDYAYSSPPSSSPERAQMLGMLDPDVPIPSLEDRPQPLVADDGKVIKQEDEESEVDQYAIPEMYRQGLASPNGSNNRDGSEDDDNESHYSGDFNGFPQAQKPFVEEGDAPPTPRASEALTRKLVVEQNEGHRMPLPQFANLLDKEDFSGSFSQYMTPSPPTQESVKKDESSVATYSQPTTSLQRPATPVEQFSQGYEDTEDDRESTPDSVIRHPIADAAEEEEEATAVIPEPSATIKAPGGRLKTRPSLAPADMQTMAETRRKVSGDRPQIPPVPEKHRSRPSMIPEGDSFLGGEEQRFEALGNGQPKRKSSLVQLEVPVEDNEERLSLGLDKEFDRLLEAQKVASAHFLRSSDDLIEGSVPGQDQQAFFMDIANMNYPKQKGYLMRQNTKLVVASSGSHSSSNDDAEAPKLPRPTSKSAGNSPVKASASWTTEPWNGKIRRKSIRQSGGSPMKRPARASGPVPPLPGMSSNVESGPETAAAEPDDFVDTETFEDGSERGRLFVKVVGVKDLDLPLPRGRHISLVVSM